MVRNKGTEEKGERMEKVPIRDYPAVLMTMNEVMPQSTLLAFEIKVKSKGNVKVSHVP